MLNSEIVYKIQFIQILGFVISLGLCFLLTPIVRNRAIRLGLLDKPTEDRRIHKTPTPRLGGIAIFLSLFLTSTFLIVMNETVSPGTVGKFPIFGVLLGASIIFILGLLDDLDPVNPKLKLLIQILAASVAWALGVRILHIINPLYHSDFVLIKISIGDRILHFNLLVSYLLTVLWIIGITNAINLIDGMDGLASGLSLISAISIWSISVGKNINEPIGALIAACLAGSLLGFLRWNFNPARIFLGDSGAYLTGFILASLTISCVMKSVTIAIMTPILIFIFAVPIVDVLLAMVRRIEKGQSILMPDKEHLHHKFLAIGFDQKRTAYIFYFIGIFCGLLATYILSHQTFLRFALLIGIVSFIFLFFSLVINYKRQKMFKRLSKKKKA